MGLLDDLKLPANNDPDKKWKCQNIMDKCKTYYNDLITAKESIVAYIIYMQHTQDSLDYAKKQFNKAKTELNDNIEDEEYKGELIKALDDSMEECETMKNSLSPKITVLENINSNLAKYLTKVTEINNTADEMK